VIRYYWKMSQTPDWAQGIDAVDLERPNPARIYDFYLGGSHNFAVDRAVGEQILQLVPQGPRIAAENRSFLRRGVRYMLGHGVRQFLDLGSGVATAGNVHEVVHEHHPGARVVYVDVEPVAVAHTRAILADVENASILHADLRDVDTVLKQAADVLDLTRPVGLLMVSVLHFLPDTGDQNDPASVIARYTGALAPGSHLLVSHLTDEFVPEVVDRVLEIYRGTSQPIVARRTEQVTALLEAGRGRLVDPGVVHVPDWHDEIDPSGARPPSPRAIDGGTERYLIGGASLLTEDETSR
jgi:hypothetical protein